LEKHKQKEEKTKGRAAGRNILVTRAGQREVGEQRGDTRAFPPSDWRAPWNEKNCHCSADGELTGLNNGYRKMEREL